MSDVLTAHIVLPGPQQWMGKNGRKGLNFLSPGPLLAKQQSKGPTKGTCWFYSVNEGIQHMHCTVDALVTASLSVLFFLLPTLPLEVQLQNLGH